MEVHNKEEIEKANEHVDIIGVNNRNLKDFTVDINQSIMLSESIPDDFIKISESGIHSTEDVFKLKNAGFKGFLMGEIFMKSSSPDKVCSNFIKRIKKQEKQLLNK